MEILRKQESKINNNFSTLPSRSTEYNKNQRIYSLQEEIFLMLTQSKTELEIARAGTVNKSVIRSNASIPQASRIAKALATSPGTDCNGRNGLW